jgi:glucose/arabinose dehydrogenase
MGEKGVLLGTAAALIGAAMLLAALPGCGPASPQPSTAPAPNGSTAASATAPSTPAMPAAVPPADLAHLRLTLQPAWRGFANPLYLTNAGDGSGRLFVVEQGGTVRVIRDGRVLDTPYLDVRQLVSAGGERGLLGLAFAPDFRTKGHVYVDYTDTQGNTVIARYTAPDPSSDSPAWRVPERLLHIDQPYSNHNGGCLQFGPDGMLYIGMGDGGSAGDPGNRAQDSQVLLGKMLRIDAEGAAVNGKYAIPSGQPVQPGWAPEVWMIGLRNPWRFSFDASGGALWIGDVGQDLWEEIDISPAGAGGQNWGWNVWEGNHAYPPGSSPSRAGFTFPVFDYPHPQGEAVTGGYVYHGSRYPALVGTYLFADYIKGWIGGIRTTAPDGAALRSPAEATLLQTSTQPASFGIDEAGELYLVDWGGTLYRIAASSK